MGALECAANKPVKTTRDCVRNRSSPAGPQRDFPECGL